MLLGNTVQVIFCLTILQLQGIVAASITTVLWSRGSKYYPHLPHRLDELALTFLIIEILLATLAFCGCWSVRKKSPVMMTLASLEGFEITVSGLQTLFLSVFSLSLCLQVLNVVLLFTLACRYGNL
ncbi:unnamed protein product [Schistocephalus solidus]|uniref:Membrane magnesium transporter n=1 Tax=Schistocephalus solidus TaxID=70667 RepID=A0A183T1H8_SCHSO|nr:unnamed protein product [Schistocephalus solidus]